MSGKHVYHHGQRYTLTAQQVRGVLSKAIRSGRLLKLEVLDDRGGNGDFVVFVYTIDGAPL